MADTPRSRGGRKRDPSRDAAIIEATLDVLAEVGYERLTMDQVAARAHAGKGTVYRRWSSKDQLVIDAATSIGGAVDPAALPDTGSLRGDFLAAYVEQSADDAARLRRLLGGLASLMTAAPELAAAAYAAVVEPFVDTNRILLRRAVQRGEVDAGLDLEIVAQVAPTMTAFRLLVRGEAFDLDHVFRLVDHVVLPAVGLAGDATARP